MGGRGAGLEKVAGRKGQVHRHRGGGGASHAEALRQESLASSGAARSPGLELGSRGQ